MSKTPPEVIDVPAAFVPRGPLALVEELAPRSKVPFAFTVVTPVYEFAPDNVRLPVPDLFNAFTEVANVDEAVFPSGNTPLMVKLPLLLPMGIERVFLT
jgi:hypothetical protein